MAFRIFLILFLFPFLVQGQDSLFRQLWTLEKCVNYALENNFEAQQYAMLVQRAQLAVQGSRNLYLPVVEGRLRNNYNWGLFIDPSTNILTTQNTQLWAGSVEGEWILFNGGYNYYTLKQNKELYGASREDQKLKKNEITLNVLAAYYQLLYAQEQLKIASAQKQQAEKQSTFIQGMVEKGVLHRRELLRMESQVAQAEVAITDAQNSIASSNLLLLQMMGVSSSNEIKLDSIVTEEIPDVLELPSHHSVFENASLSLPQLSASRSRVEARRYGIRAAQALRYPSFSISAGLLTKSSTLNPVEQNLQFRNNLSKYIAFNLRVPLINRFQTTNAISVSKIDLMIQENELRRAGQLAEQKIQKAYLDLSSAHKKYSAVLKQMQAVESQYTLMEKSYVSGIVNFTEYSYTSSIYRNTMLQLLQAKYDFLYKRKVFDFYRGKNVSAP